MIRFSDNRVCVEASTPAAQHRRSRADLTSPPAADGGGAPDSDRPAAADPWGSIELTLSGGHRSLRLTGEVDTWLVESFEASIPGAIAFDSCDLSGVTFMAVRGLTLLTVWADESRAAGHAPILRGIPLCVQRLLDLAGIGQGLESAGASAAAALARPGH